MSRFISVLTEHYPEQHMSAFVSGVKHQLAGVCSACVNSHYLEVICDICGHFESSMLETLAASLNSQKIEASVMKMSWREN